ncbi:uncharacterized mitochondrial protein AtMg01250-like [Nicotiana tomentosiformis]|uniref:uncharacterized mitochondrial protein AtMg01250-like n=1 Tax=Nicotiana tomentosiformis TaxID=4098 RepID=UPI00388C8FB2
MLTQEIVHNINQSPQLENVVMKLDMAKAYDRVDWDYLCQVLRQMGFSEVWIDRVWRLISNVWYSINLNGSRQGFFKSSRGIKQGYPIFPSLFVIGAELLSRMMNRLPEKGFIPYSSERRGPLITHLCYADDTILFFSGDPISLKMMMNELESYETISGQMINKSKSSFYVSTNFPQSELNKVEDITGFSQLQFPM